MAELVCILQGFEAWFWGVSSILAHLTLQIVLCVRVIMSRTGVGATLAWVMVIIGLPLLGPLFYLLIGELRLGAARVQRIEKLAGDVAARLHALEPIGRQIDWSQYGYSSEQLSRAGLNTLHGPALPGNHLELISDWQAIFDRIVADIDQAKINCDLQFYIWNSGGRSEEVVDALIRACQRGVTCRLLVDALGSRPFLKGAEFRRLRAAGAQIVEALPGRIWRLPLVRFDLRMHRKIVLIDDRIGFTGSLNLVDPRYFKQNAGVGQWVDAMVRVQGPAVEALAITFQTDWHIESKAPGPLLPDLTGNQPIVSKGNSVVQVLPSGPAFSVEAIEQILITAIYSAHRELVITSPYFVPSEALFMALASAAQRGVRVIVILPAKVDSLLVRYASRAFKGYLLDSGVEIALFDGGLLHTKSVTIDGRSSLFGSLNMDPRSLRLNFEITLIVHDAEFTSELRALQESYLVQSQSMDADAWRRRSSYTRFLENTAQLFGPLL
jgi:cardiolipin synthase A/B